MLTRAPRQSLLTVLTLLAALAFTGPARAYTPESGVWWNPNEPGTGLILDLQDNFLAVSLFVGDTSGDPIWYTSTGFLIGNARYEGTLDYFPGAQCIGCGFRPVNPQLGVGGAIRIIFDPNDPSLATLTIGGRTTNIERFRFYFKRPEDEQALPGVSENLTRLMGEWSAVLDYSTSGQGQASYFGDVLIFDNLDFDNLGDFVDGCRPAESLGGFCSASDLDLRYAVAEYVSEDDSHVIVVENSPTTFASYFIELDTNEFRGEISVYNRGSNPSIYFPARGFRSASRTFVEDGTGPSRKAGGASVGLPVTAGATAANPVVRSKATLDRMNAVRERLETQLQQRRAGKQTD
jgi:hypothetical protein